MGLVFTGFTVQTYDASGYHCVTNPPCLCSGMFSPVVPLVLAATGTTQFTVDTPGRPLRAIQLTVDSGTGQTLQQYTVHTTPPGGTPQYTLLNQPTGATQRTVQFTLNNNTGVIPISQLTVQNRGVFRPNQNFAVWPGGPNGTWQFTVVNAGVQPGVLNQCVLFFDNPMSPFTLATAANSVALDVTLQLTVGGGTPTYVSVNWGDGATPQEEWFGDTTDKTHTYAAPDTYTITTRVWTDDGAYTEDTTTISPTSTITYTGPGTYTWTPTSSGTTTGEAFAPGGNGGGGNATRSGGGAGEGGHSKGTFSVTSGVGVTIVIPIAGVASVTINSTSVVANSGANGATPGQGVGGTAGTGNIFATAGANGTAGSISPTATGGTGGGTGGGAGGVSPADGGNGANPSAGGGGGGATNGGGASNGGNGGTGRVVITPP